MPEGNSRVLLIVAAVAVGAYFLFFRNSSSSTGGASSGDTQTTGATTLQKGAIAITVSDNTAADNDPTKKPPPKKKPPKKKPVHKVAREVHHPKKVTHPGTHEVNPQPKPPARSGTVASHSAHTQPTISRPPVGTRMIPGQPGYKPPRNILRGPTNPTVGTRKVP